MSDEARYVWWHRNEGSKPVIVRTKRKRIHVVLQEGCGLIVRKVPLEEARNMKDATDQPIRKAASAMRAFGRRRGCTKEAREFLRGI
jgi:hypothetical protein